MTQAILTPGATASPSLEISQLFKSYGRQPVLAGMDMCVEPGNIVGLVGLNGAGKTTAISCMLGLQHYERGTINVLGSQPAQLYRIRGQVAAVFDEPCLQPNFRVDDILRFAQLSVAGQDSAFVETVLQWLGLERYRRYKVRHLSLGNRRRTAIAQALVTRPTFIILDEPFNGLDAGGVDDVLALIRKLNREQGITFLLASHQLPYLESICSHMSILHEGKVVSQGRMNTLLAHERPRVAITATDTAAVQQFLKQQQDVMLLSELAADEVLYCELLNITSAGLNRLLVENGFQISELHLHKASLESLFRTITGTDP